jgi:CRISPR/Cas system-associated exonuclease Cas4 (RecB family)
MIDKENYNFGLKNYANACFLREWKKNLERLNKLGLSSEQLEHYLIESMQMISKFVDNFSIKLGKEISRTNDLKAAFENLKPIVEEEIINTDLQVKGFIDAIHSFEGDIVIMDYKTSNKDELTADYRLQLAIYALLYELKYGKMPKRLGINFLKFGEKCFDVDESVLEDAKREILLVHQLTENAEKIIDYPKKESPLCKWSSGQCDFYDNCCKER